MGGGDDGRHRRSPPPTPGGRCCTSPACGPSLSRSRSSMWWGAAPSSWWPTTCGRAAFCCWWRWSASAVRPAACSPSGRPASRAVPCGGDVSRPWSSGACRRRGARGPQVARCFARLLPGRAGGGRGRRCGIRVPPFFAHPIVRHVSDPGRRGRAGDVPAQPRRRPPARARRGRRRARRRDVRRHAAGGGGGLRPVPARGAAGPGRERRPRQLSPLRGAGRRRHVVSQRDRGGRDDPVRAARDSDRHVSLARPPAGVRRPSGEPVHAAGRPVSAARRRSRCPSSARNRCARPNGRWARGSRAS